MGYERNSLGVDVGLISTEFCNNKANIRKFRFIKTLRKFSYKKGCKKRIAYKDWFWSVDVSTKAYSAETNGS
jgi:hypothetical protein